MNTKNLFRSLWRNIRLKTHEPRLKILGQEMLGGMYSVFKYFVSAIVIFYVANIIYGSLNKFSFQRFSDPQLREIISAQTNSDDYEFEYVNFRNHNPSIAVLVNSDVDEADIMHKSERPARLSIFEKAAKNPLEKILFDTDLYQKTHTYDLVPDGNEEDYMLVRSSLRVIDLFNDGNQEIFFCLMFAFGGSGTNFECSIFDGEYFYPAFPKAPFIETEQNDDYVFTIDQVESDYGLSWGEAEPIFADIGSDNLFYFNDADDSMTFLEMIWGDDESHADPHLYRIYHYTIKSQKDFLWEGSNNLLFIGGYVRTTTERERGKPFDVLVENYLKP